MEWVPEVPAITHNFGLTEQDSKKPTCTTGYSTLNAW